MNPIVGIKGMNDLLPHDAPLWELFQNTVQSVLKSYGYLQMSTPIVESTALFTRGLGAVTDIVEKEMYSFTDNLNGDQLTLRPENTAGVVRAVIEHNLTYDGPKRLWYSGPMFRHERPQRGRYRQFHQVGAEAIGFGGPDIDAELIMLCKRIWDDLGLTGVRLELNSIGNAAERQAHRSALITYLEQHLDLLDEDAKRRLHTNPLRILDTKNPALQELANQAPQLLNYLGDESLEHFAQLQTILRYNGIAYQINPRLVRGLDYYNRSVFEWVTDQLGAQGTICGGGRYDPLVEMCGGKPTPACGFAMGVERLIELMKISTPAYAPRQCDIYLVHQNAEAQLRCFVLAEQLRDAGLDVMLHCAGNTGGGGGNRAAGSSVSGADNSSVNSVLAGAVTHAAGSFKSQLKRADATGAKFALIIGEEELKTDQVSVKSLRAVADSELAHAQQISLPISRVIEYLLDTIAGTANSADASAAESAESIHLH